ncbi:MAG TPA: porin [Polyangia bacterium]|nr:porin [Polyangia bacterium]
MRGTRVSSLLSAAVLASAISLCASSARADITIYDNDGWSLYARGLIASHYQLAVGKGDPSSMHGVVVGGTTNEGGAKDPKDDSILLSRVRSGFIGTQMGFGVRRMISQTVHVDSLVAINLADISSNRQQEANKSVDVREAWASVIGPAGTFRFGRMFNIYASGGAPIILLSHRYGVGNPCFVNQPTIACGPVGAGPQFANFDAQLRYESPRFAALQLQAAVVDPDVTPDLQMTPYPRIDAELNFDQSFGAAARLRAWVQMATLTLNYRPSDFTMPLLVQQALGVFGSALLDAGPLSIGGGGWQCKGCGTRTFMEVGDSSNPLSADASKHLRTGRGFFGNAAVRLPAELTVAAGAGISYMEANQIDAPELYIDPMTMMPGQPSTSLSILKSSAEGHVTLAKQFDAVVLEAEFMYWHNEWHYGEHNTLVYTGAGANYVW